MLLKLKPQQKNLRFKPNISKLSKIKKRGKLPLPTQIQDDDSLKNKGK